MAAAPNLHDLKCWPQFFVALAAGRKHHEIRRADRDYLPGDTLLIREWDPSSSSYTGRNKLRVVTAVYHLDGIGIPGFVSMELE